MKTYLVLNQAPRNEDAFCVQLSTTPWRRILCL